VNWGRRWYLVAWDVDRAAWRTFRVDRLEPRLPLGAHFEPRPLPDDDVASYVARGISEAAWRYRARVTVHAPAELISERIGRWVGTIEPIDATTCIVDLGADSVEVLAVYLGMIGADFTLGPDAVELADQVRRLGDRYRAAISA